MGWGRDDAGQEGRGLCEERETQCMHMLTYLKSNKTALFRHLNTIQNPPLPPLNPFLHAPLLLLILQHLTRILQRDPAIPHPLHPLHKLPDLSRVLAGAKLGVECLFEEPAEEDVAVDAEDEGARVEHTEEE